MIWAASERYSEPQFVAAYGEGLHDAMPEEFEHKAQEAKEWYRSFALGDEPPWTFWTTFEAVPLPTGTWP